MKTRNKKRNSFQRPWCNAAMLCMIMLVSACANNEHIVGSSDTVSYELQYGFYSSKDRRLDNHQESNLVLFFPAIPGALFGDPGIDLVAEVVPSDPTSFVLDLPKDADSSSGLFEYRSLRIQPKNVTMLRLGTFHFLPKYESTLGGGGFRNIRNNNPVILVYFSSPATVSGEVVLQSGRYQHDVRIKNAGWHWIEIEVDAEDRYTLRRYDGDTSNIEFQVFLHGSIET